MRNITLQWLTILTTRLFCPDGTSGCATITHKHPDNPTGIFQNLVNSIRMASGFPTYYQGSCNCWISTPWTINFLHVTLGTIYRFHEAIIKAWIVLPIFHSRFRKEGDFGYTWRCYHVIPDYFCWLVRPFRPSIFVKEWSWGSIWGACVGSEPSTNGTTSNDTTSPSPRRQLMSRLTSARRGANSVRRSSRKSFRRSCRNCCKTGWSHWGALAIGAAAVAAWQEHLHRNWSSHANGKLGHPLHWSW